MERLLFIGFGIFILASLVLPWVLLRKVRHLSSLMETLKRHIDLLETIPEISQVKEDKQASPLYTPSEAVTPWPDALADEPEHPEIKAAPDRSAFNFEQQFGARLPVWIGGVALALAGFFLVKYSIDNNLLSPEVRVMLGGLFGIGLLLSAGYVRARAIFDNSLRIAQSLSGAGIAVLYVCTYASVSLYDLVPTMVGFVGMALVTVMAVTLSLLHGAPIALLGLVGGFLTPALVDSHDPSAPILFLYLYGVFSALMIVIRRKRWWVLSIPSLIGAFIWVGLWMTGNHYSPDDTIWLGLFLLGVSATIIITSRTSYEADDVSLSRLFTLTSCLNYLGLGGALVLMGVVAGQGGFGLMEWGLFGVLAIGGIMLGWFKEKLYGFVPMLAMGVNAVMFVAWKTPDYNLYALMLLAFSGLYIIGGYLLMFRARMPLMWAALSGVTAIGYYLIAWFKLHNTALLADIPMGWGILALILASMMVYALQEGRRVLVPSRYTDYTIALFAVAATTLLSLALTVEIPREFLSVAFAGEVLALAWIYARTGLVALRPLAAVLALVFGFLLIPQILLLLQLTAYSLVEAKLHLQKSVPLVDWPAFQLGLPAILFLSSGYLLRKTQDGRLVQALEIASIALVAVMGYYLTRHMFHVEADVLFKKASFFERGVTTNILFVYGLACMWAGRVYVRKAIHFSGIVLCGVAMFRIGYFDLLISNPLWVHHKIEGVPLFNSMLLPYALPLVWLMLGKRELRLVEATRFDTTIHGLMLLMVFALINLNIRLAFHGEYLDGAKSVGAELYSYSAAWLVMGIALLVAGVSKMNKGMRLASLGLMVLAVGKVFLVDASELEGLWRVASFFGLGICLLGLSWFYTKFVFGDRQG